MSNSKSLKQPNHTDIHTIVTNFMKIRIRIAITPKEQQDEGRRETELHDLYLPISLYFQQHRKEQREKEEDLTTETVHWKANTSKAMRPNNHSLLADLGSFINVSGRTILNKNEGNS